MGDPLHASFAVRHATVDGWSFPVLVGTEKRPPLALVVRGAIGNSITTSPSGAKRTTDWKRSVCDSVFRMRGSEPWISRSTYLVTLAYRFCPELHGGRDLDVENFMKPTVDAIAAGLFLAGGEDPCNVARYGFDDSGFRHLLVHRLEDAAAAHEEGVGIHLACCG